MRSVASFGITRADCTIWTPERIRSLEYLTPSRYEDQTSEANMNAALSDSPLTEGVLRCIAAPVETGTGLPNACYTSEDWLALENQRIFAQTWMLAGFCHDIPGRGDACPVKVAGVPILLLRDGNGEICAFHNVCRHRGAILLDAPCTSRKVLTCPYHAWTYALDGKLRSRPHFYGGGKHDVDPGDELPGLVPVRNAVWHDLIFVDLSGHARSFDEHWSPFAKRMQAYDFSALRYASTLDFDIKGNWKLIYENFFDPYHVPRVHPRLDKYTPMSKRPATWTDGNWFYSTLPIDEPQMGRSAPLPYYPGIDDKTRHTEWFYHLFPTTCLQIWPDQLAVFQLHALAPDHTIEHIHMYFIGEAATEPAFAQSRQSAYDMWQQLNTEDFTIVESMQVARSSPAFDGGMLSPYWDRATQHFAKLVVGAMQ